MPPLLNKQLRQFVHLLTTYITQNVEKTDDISYTLSNEGTLSLDL